MLQREVPTDGFNPAIELDVTILPANQGEKTAGSNGKKRNRPSEFNGIAPGFRPGQAEI